MSLRVRVGLCVSVVIGLTLPFTLCNAMEVIGQLTGGNAQDVIIDGDLAYIAGSTCLLILDVSDPANPIQAAWFQTSGSPRSLRTSGDYVYTAAGDAGLVIIDVSDPEHPLEVGSCNTLVQPTWSGCRRTMPMSRQATQVPASWMLVIPPIPMKFQCSI